MVEVLSALSARPPTPPKAISRFPFGAEIDRVHISEASLETPGDSPSSASESANLHSGGRSKKVNFSPWTNYIKPPTFSNSSISKIELRSLPRSNECKPSKSILKTTHNTTPPSPSNCAPQTVESFAMLLESVTRQLASETLTSRLDAYIHLLGSLKAYEGLPHEQAMLGKLSLLTQFVQRDICRNLERCGPMDVNLAIHALKLAIVFVWDPVLSKHLTDDFRIFIVDQSINSLQQARVPKSVLIHYMHVLSTQKFSSKIVTNARVGRAITALNDVTDRVNGNGILSQRLSIYQRLLSQSKSTVASQSAQWIEHLISGLLHHIRDIRSKAISFGIQVSLVLGPNTNMSNTIEFIFDKPLGQDRTMILEICERMSRMMPSTESGIHVPQIWSVIVLLLRRKRFNIDQWCHFKEWVRVLQKCFNCSEPVIKAQAIVAWNRFVYAINPNESTSPTMIRMLGKPIFSQLERKKNDKSGALINQIALSSYYNLLYYVFRPSVSFQYLDTVWDEYVAQPLSTIFPSIPSLAIPACHVLSSLLWSSQAKVWTESKAIETSKLETEDLPSLDCKWIRSRVPLVLKVFEVLFKLPVWSSETLKESSIAVAWDALSKALSSASSKEVKPSTELMQAVAGILGLLQRLWNSGPTSLSAVGERAIDVFFDRFHFLCTSIISTVGSLPFTEKLLLKTHQETFQTANTPTHRCSRNDTNLDTPIIHLLRLMSSFSELSAPNASYHRLIEGVLKAASKGRLSRGARIDFFERCSDLYPAGPDSHPSNVPALAQFIWEETAALTEDSLHSFPVESVKNCYGAVAYDYDNVVKILSRGLHFPDAFSRWSQLLSVFVRVIREELGKPAVVNIIIEPLIAYLKILNFKQILLPSKALLDHILPLSTYQAGSSDSKTTGLHHSLSDPHQDVSSLSLRNLFELLNKILSESYGKFDPTETTNISEIIECLASSLEDNSLSIRHSILEALQPSLSMWIKDESHKLSTEHGTSSQILIACRTLSAAVVRLLQSLPPDSTSLQKFEIIVAGGLESCHKSTVNMFIELWNTKFGLQDALEYPQSVLRALRKLEPFVELLLPSLPLLKEALVDQKAPHFLNSQNEDMSQPIEMGIRRIKRFTPQTSRFSSSSVFQAVKPSTPLFPKRGNDLTPRQLLHNNSQIQFLAVNSSPFRCPKSQLLTEHQSEVKERQRSETSALFEGFSSSPALPSKTKDLNWQTPPTSSALRKPAPTTDIQLATVSSEDDIFLASSPTPGSKGQPQSPKSKITSSLLIQALEPYDDSDLPSSPPELTSLALKHGRILLRNAPPNTITSRLPTPEKDDSNVAQDDNMKKSIPPKSDLLLDGEKERESSAGDMILESFGDELELQLASQLEQDLGSALNPVIQPNIQPSLSPVKSSPVTKKRKRDASRSPRTDGARRKRSKIASSENASMKAYESHGVQTSNIGSEVEITGETILSSLRNVLNSIKGVTFGKDTLREIDDVMFDIRVESHEALRRHNC